MQNLDIQSGSPNQVVQFDYNNTFYSIHLYTVYCNTNSKKQREYLTIADVVENGNLVIAGVRCVPNSFLIPQKYQVSEGNFRWECVDNDYPFYTKFNQTQQLVFYTTAEIESMS